MNEYLLNILRFVKKYHRWRVITIICNYGAIGIFLFLCLTLFLQIFFAIFPLAIFIQLWDFSFILLITFILSIVFYILIINPPTLISTVKILEKKSNVKHPFVSLAIELVNSFDPKNELYEETYKRAHQLLPVLGKIPYYNLNRRKISLLTLTITLVVLCFFIVKPQLLAYWKLPLVDMSRGSFTVFPGTKALPKFSSVELKLIPRGVTTPSSQLILSDIATGRRITKLLRPSREGIFSYYIDSLENSFVYYFLCNDKYTPSETIKVVPPPYLSSLQVELIPPAYSNKKTIKLPFGEGDISALGGTIARFYLEVPYLKSAKIFYGKDTLLFKCNNGKAIGEMRVKESGEYTISLEDTFAQRTDTAAKFYIKVIPDEIPFVNFIRPAINKALEPAQQETLFIECVDDFGVSKLDIFYFKSGDDEKKTLRIELSPEKPVPLYQKIFVWKIFKLSLYPGDTLYYWARVVDTKTPSPQSATTDTFWFRVPSFEEIHKKIAAREECATASLRDVMKGQKELLKNLDNIKRELLSSNKSQWEREQIVNKIENIISEQIDSLKESVKKLEENIEQLNKEGNIGEEILKKMEEIQKSLEELIAMYGDSLFFKRNDNSEISLNEMKEAIDRMREILPELNERLENTLKYLETLKRDRELAELAMKAEKLAEEQSLLSQKREGDLANLKLKEKELLKRIEKLSSEIKEKEDIKIKDSLLQKIDSLQKEMEKDISQGEMPSSSQMNRMSANLAGLASELRQKMSSYLLEQLEALRKGLFNIVSQTLDLLDWQDKIKKSENSTEEEILKKVRSQQLINESLKYLKNSIDSLSLLPLSARKIFNRDLREIESAVSSVLRSLGENGNTQIAFEHSQRAMKKLAMDILEYINQMDKQQSSGQCNSGCASLRDALRRLSGKQAAINAATAELLKDLLRGKGGRKREGGRGSEENGGEGENIINEKARREAQEAQQKLAEDLKKLSEKFGGVSPEEMKRRVEELEKEAREISRMLQEPKEEVTERQDRFLARMLQAALSLHREEDEKEERKSTTAKVIFDTPKNIRLDSLLINKQDMFYLMRRKAIEHGNYPPSYRTSINNYFDSLRSVFVERGK